MKSGNSETFSSYLNNKKIFQKVFDSTRIYNFYQEYFIIKYLQKIGFDYIPSLLGIDKEKKILIYEYLDSVDLKDFQKVRLYEKVLKDLILKVKNSNIKLRLHSKESLINTKDCFFQIKRRLEAHKKNVTSLKEYKNLIKKIDEAFKIFGLELLKLEHSSEFIFSQADVGIHNCIFSGNNNIHLVDMEYAGLDSPIKLHIDYLLHPKNVIFTCNSFDWSEYFFQNLISDEDLRKINVYNSIFSIKWSLIVLNEFLNQNWQLRLNADPSRQDRRDKIMRNQLKKSDLYLKASYRLYERAQPQKIFKESERILLSKSY